MNRMTQRVRDYNLIIGKLYESVDNIYIRKKRIMRSVCILDERKQTDTSLSYDCTLVCEKTLVLVEEMFAIHD